MLNSLLISLGWTLFPKHIFFLCRNAAHTIFPSSFSLCGIKVLLCAGREWHAPAEMPSFPSSGRTENSPPPQDSGQEPAQLGELSLRGKGEGRRDGAPKAPGPSWPSRSLLLSPCIEITLYPSFHCAPGFTSGLLMVLKDHLPSLFSNWRWQVSVCFKYCCGGTDFSKELSFITGHVNALCFMSLGSSTMCCVKRIGLAAKHNCLFYSNAKKKDLIFRSM